MNNWYEEIKVKPGDYVYTEVGNGDFYIQRIDIRNINDIGLFTTMEVVYTTNPITHPLGQKATTDLNGYILGIKAHYSEKRVITDEDEVFALLLS